VVGTFWFYSSEYARAKLPAILSNTLRFNALWVNIKQPKGADFGGIKWEEGYNDIRLSIENSSGDLIRDLTLRVEVLAKGANLFAMGQVTDMAGCEFHPPPLPDVGIQLKDKDGQIATVTLNDVFTLASKGKFMPSMGNTYDMFCSKLLPRQPLRLALAAGEEDEQIRAMRVSGSYESAAKEGNQRITFDENITVARP